MFNVSLGDFGRIGIEYWVLAAPTKENKKPSMAFVNPARPIVLTLNGQNQGEMSQVLIRKDAELPFLTQRLIAHIDCNNLSATSKRLLFVSNRESQRDVKVRDLIQQEVVKALRSDDTLARLNSEARQQGMQQQDETAMKYMRNEVARLLRLQGADFGNPVGGDPRGINGDGVRPATPRPPRPAPEPIELHEPPTFIRFVIDEGRDFTFYAEQRRYLRIETDANSTYHDPYDPHRSNVNIIVGGISSWRVPLCSKMGGCAPSLRRRVARWWATWAQFE
jgi:alkylhydroperoxidase family enzyme